MFKSILQLVVGNGIVQISAFLAAPFITRFYGEDIVGAFGLVAAISGFLVPIFTLRLELSLPAEKNDDIAKNVLSTALCLSICLFIFFSAAYHIGIKFYPDSLKINAVGFSPFWLLLLSINQIFVYWFVREGRFNVIAKSNLIRGLLQNTTIFIPLVFFVSFSAFMWAKIISGLIVCFWLYLQSKQVLTLKKLFVFHPSVIVRNRDYTTHGVFQALLNGFGSYLPQFVFAYQYSLATLGQLSMAFFLVQAPTGLLSQAIRQVFHKKLADLLIESMPKAVRFYGYSVLTLFSTYILSIVIYWFIGEKLITSYLGSGWIEAFEYSKWLAIWFGMTVINPIPNVVLQVIERQRVLSFYEALYLATRIICVVVFFFATDTIPLYLIQLLSSIGFLFNCFIVIYVYHELRKTCI